MYQTAILGLLLVLLAVFYLHESSVPVSFPSSSSSQEKQENYQNYRPERNSFRTYFRRDTFQGQRVDWKPSLPYYHHIPEYGAYARQGKEDCLATGPPEL